MINMERRKRVMQRSIKLGHCICDPKQPCPCDLFKAKNICQCAGERLDSPTGPVQLTKIVEKAGCASKIDQAFLKDVLKNLPEINDPRVLVGVPAGDDAGVYDMGDNMALVQTVDVFTPSVDDPYTFGQVAAANSVSDVYAMGGVPITAVSILGFPVRKIPDEAMSQILAGGIDKMNEAGVAIIGGHSINDNEIKAGFAVTGVIETDKIITNSNAQPGDVLILTKPLGTGIVAFASQISKARPESIEAIKISMTTLNKRAAELMIQYGANSCTDVTGFSLMGHLSEMALSSGVDVEIAWDEIPLFPGVLEYAAQGILPGAIERNKESCGKRIVISEKLPQEMIDICYDAQTSGGLLISIAKDDANNFLKALHIDGITDAAIIGEVTQKGSGLVYINYAGTRNIPDVSETPQEDRRERIDERGDTSNEVQETKDESRVTSNEQQTDVPCCADAISPSGDSKSGVSRIKSKFTEFLGAASSPHGLDAYTKQAMAIALSVAMRCEPCLKMYLKKAKEKGFTQDEIDEAAWMGISFAGSPAMVFYEQLKKG